MADMDDPVPTTLLFSIDTEEDNWTPTRDGVTVENIRELPRFHRFLGELGIRPTYFTAYRVLREPWAAAVIREIAGDGEAEVGAHLHAWNTPPLEEPLGGANTMLWNLPPDLQRRKLETLTAAFRDVLEATPRTFRAGRFGLGAALVPALIDLGYTTDSSVTPNWSWHKFDRGPDFRGAPLRPYRLDRDTRNPAAPNERGPLLELPLSIGYSRRPFSFWRHVHAVTDTRMLRALRAPGVAARLGLRKAIISPEGERTADLLSVSRQLVRETGGYLHVFLHSSSLLPGLTPFARTSADVSRIYRRTAELIEGLSRSARIEFTTPSRLADDTLGSRVRVPSGR